MRQELHRLVFIDETAVKTNLTRLRGRAPVGERLYSTAPFGKWGTQSGAPARSGLNRSTGSIPRRPSPFIAGLTRDAMIAPWVIKGAPLGRFCCTKSPAGQWMNRAAFDTYIETQRAPALDPGTVVILPSHRIAAQYDCRAMDNLSTHKSPRATEALRKRGCWLFFGENRPRDAFLYPQTLARLQP